MFKHKTRSKSVSPLHRFLCTTLPLCKILYVPATHKGLPLGVTCKNISGGDVVVCSWQGKNTWYA